MIKRVSHILQNKYAIAILAFVIWMMFFDRNNFINQFRLVSAENGLIRQKEYYLGEIKNDSIDLYTLKTDTAYLEKFAREKYLMKKDNEDIFLIIEED